MKLHHNKKRNIGLVYEFLTREITHAIISENKEKAAKVISILNKHLSDGTDLYEELSLHQQVMEARGSSAGVARRVVDELKAAGIRFSGQQTRESAKTSLIHEINYTLGKDLFDKYRVPEYTAHASINILLSRGLSGRIDEGVEIAKIEEHLVEFLTSKNENSIQFDQDASLFAYKKAVSLFEQEYGAELVQDQRDILKEYIKVSLGGHINPFIRLFDKQKKSLIEILKISRSDEAFSSDEDMSKKLDEAIVELENLQASATDEAVEQLILYHKLKREIQS